MSRTRSKISDFTVYVVVRCVVCLLQVLSPDTARSFASGLAWILYHVDRRHRLVALENINCAFPNKYSDRKADQFVRSVYRHFCTLLIEIIHLPRKLHTNTWRRYLSLGTAGPQVVERLLSGRPLLVLTGHFGNWEMAGYALGLLGFHAHAIARPLDNPFLDDYLRRFRESTGQKLLAKKGDFDQMENVLRSGGVMATLADQDAGPRGLFVEFFGRPASTHKAVALLCLEHSVPLFVCGARRTNGLMSYELIAEDLIFPEEYDGRPGAVAAITQRFTCAFERVVRSAPEQYFWLHRRWKHQPKTKKTKQAA